MEPAHLRAVLARTPGLTAAHLFACMTGQSFMPVELLSRLLAGPLPARTRAGLEHPDTGLIDVDLRWSEADEPDHALCGCR